MRARSPIVVLLASPLLLLALVAPAAADAPEPLRVDYQAPAGCPDRDAFFGDVLRRTSRARPAAGSENARLLRVRIERIERTSATFVGRISIQEDSATSSAREVSGSTCAEVASALGVVAALAVDPRASVAPALAATSPPPPPGGEAPATSDERTTTPRETAARPAAAATPAEQRAEPVTTAAPSPPATRPPPRFGVGLQGELAVIAGPVGAWRLFFDFDPIAARGLLAPTLRLAVGRTFVDVERNPSIGSARFRWTVAALDACPIAVSIGASVAVKPCAGFGGGVVEADASGIQNPSDRSRPWLAASVQGRLVWAPVRAVAIDLEAGVLAPLLRENFFFEPSGLDVYRAPSLAFVGRLGGAYRFP